MNLLDTGYQLIKTLFGPFSATKPFPVAALPHAAILATMSEEERTEAIRETKDQLRALLPNTPIPADVLIQCALVKGMELKRKREVLAMQESEEVEVEPADHQGERLQQTWRCTLCDLGEYRNAHGELETVYMYSSDVPIWVHRGCAEEAARQWREKNLPVESSGDADPIDGAAALAEMGIKPGDEVVLTDDNGNEVRATYEGECEGGAPVFKEEAPVAQVAKPPKRSRKSGDSK